ncbi:MAG: spermidine synthase [Kiritimatiellia bacterium]
MKTAYSIRMAFYASAVFLSAFLLFLIQPMLTKALLPTYGGSYLVWGAAMVFFQSVLLLGYLLSHHVQVQCGVFRYARWHLFVLLVPFCMFPFRLDWGTTGAGSYLAYGVFWQLLRVAGLPFLVLSMTSTLLQRWLMVSDLPQRENPYVLYAASNAGSVMALLAYPVLIEPISTLAQQAGAWWAGYMLLVMLHVLVLPRGQAARAIEPNEARGNGVTWAERQRWFLLSLATGTLLLATTNVITFDIAAMPLLWVVPLALFLLAFVLVFKSRMWCPVWMQAALNWCMILGGGLVLLLRFRVMLPPGGMLLAYLLVLFVACMNSNRRLVHLKPSSGRGLTEFYVILAAGGLCGSLLVSWLLPLVTHSLLEYPIGLLLVLIAVGLADANGWRRTFDRGHLVWGGICLGVFVLLPHVLPQEYPANLVFAMLALPWALYVRYSARSPLAAAIGILLIMVTSGGMDRFASGGRVVARLRNYYGIYQVYDHAGIRYLQHGTTQHGRQYLDALRRSTPLGYYHPTTPAARIMRGDAAVLQDVGMIGLGSGAITAYARPDQVWTIFELDPDNLYIAETYFGYLAQARAQGADLHFVFGDGRLRVAAQPPGSFDVLIMDAFSSGSIPVHLLTVEAFDVYRHALRADGLLLIHVSNRVLDLVPVVHANARAIGMHAVTLSNEGQMHPEAENTVWVAIAAQPERLEDLLVKPGMASAAPAQLPRPWTDSYSHVLRTIRWF